MRTVTFSDAQVARVVNKHFVCAWFNRSPGFTNNDYTTEKNIFKGSAEAYTTRNICTFVLAPDGRVFTYVAGYLSPELFLRFINGALELRRTAFDGRMRLDIKPIRSDGVRATTLQFAFNFQFDLDEDDKIGAIERHLQNWSVAKRKSGQIAQAALSIGTNIQ